MRHHRGGVNCGGATLRALASARNSPLGFDDRRGPSRRGPLRVLPHKFTLPVLGPHSHPQFGHTHHKVTRSFYAATYAPKAIHVLAVRGREGSNAEGAS
jgi:hypothetical protein